VSKPHSRSPENEATLAETGKRVLEVPELAGEQQVDRPPVRAGRSDPSFQHRRAGALLGLGQQVEQDRELGLVVELASDDLERIGV
jgi:hypothetical protein